MKYTAVVIWSPAVPPDLSIPRPSDRHGETWRCPLCESDATIRFHSEEWISIRRCRECSFLFSEDREGDFRRDSLAEEIDAFYRTLEASRDARIPLMERRLQQIRARFGLGESLTLLEVGTGGGALAAACSRNGHRYIGLEPLLEESFHLDEIRALPGVEVIPSRLEDYAPDTEFDVVALDNVLEHLANPVQAVQRLLALLRPGGVLWVQVPNEAGLRFKHGLFSLFKERRITFPGHVNLFTRRSLERCLHAGGGTGIVLRSTSASDPVLSRLLLTRSPPLFLRIVMAGLRTTRLDVRLGCGYWLDGYARPAK